jgi:hypothetical protein
MALDLFQKHMPKKNVRFIPKTQKIIYSHFRSMLKPMTNDKLTIDRWLPPGGQFQKPPYDDQWQ